MNCPWCGADFEMMIDPGEGSHESVHDCYWCCAPIVVNVVLSEIDGTPEVRLSREDGSDE
ncbi:CPXCG motif-containing cysteine-rich protein [Kushneria sinocarnis]|uniref:CPXCG motif-containing cysteine-rich protein n=1 Tax=Kushneria sinocarnis TaxID=595502 RepID=UPI002482A1FA|nr:CPXCG motif-containing cysteine-rich protein [Kushneria sinocarnis]